MYKEIVATIIIFLTKFMNSISIIIFLIYLIYFAMQAIYFDIVFYSRKKGNKN